LRYFKNRMENTYHNNKEYTELIKNEYNLFDNEPTRDKLYYTIGYVYANQKKFKKAINFYIKALHINSNNLIYTNLFELQLIQNQPFDQKLEKKYIELFQNKKESFIYYEMLKILQNITHNKKVNLEQWKQKYRGVEMGWDFDILDEWIDRFDEGEVKERLREAIGVFKGHR